MNTQPGKPVVMFDLDGVLADFTNEFKRRAENESRRALPEITTWRFYNLQWGYSDDWFRDRMNEWTSDGMFRNLNIYPGAASAVQHVMDLGYHVHFYTARPEHSATDTCIWLSKHFGPQAWKWSMEVQQGVKSGGHRFHASIDDHYHNWKNLAATGCRNSNLCLQPWTAQHTEAISLQQFVTSLTPASQPEVELAPA